MTGITILVEWTKREDKLKRSSLVILLLISTLGCVGNQSSYDAIDLVPEEISGYETVDRKVDIHIREAEERCFSSAVSSAAGLYSKGEINGSITVFECESEDEAKETIIEYAQSQDISEIELEKGIRAKQFGIGHFDTVANGTWTRKTMVVIVWQEKNFISNLWAIGPDSDSFDTGKDLANSIILQSPL